MATISLCMIVKNEEAVLARCLESVRGAVDEIIIVDTGSTDGTKQIAQRFTDKVYDFEWIDDFSAARNFAFSKGTMDYLMWLDADDVLEEPDRDGLILLKESLDPSVDVVMLRYRVGGAMSYYRERLLRREAGFRWAGAVHEAITPSGNIIHSELAVTHRKLRPSDPDRNLRIFEKMVREGTRLGPREQFYYARELYYHERYQDAIRLFQEFLDSGLGWVENCIDACRQTAYCWQALGNGQEALKSLAASFAYDTPRAETCCDLGRHYFDMGDFKRAAFWYETALRCERADETGGFVTEDCYGYIPLLQLCVCYDRLGDKKRAREYNERAAAFRPEDSAVLQNRAYFASMMDE